MTKRAAVCIGVNRAGRMTPLQAAVEGAVQMEEWAKSQGCITRLLTDGPDQKVLLAHVFEAVDEFVQAGTYEQLIIYFSGHGVLTAPGTEFWLLSGAPQNPNEAVNLFRSVEDARNSGIPHVVFISDACRSAVQGPPLSGIIGGVIFPNLPIGPQRGEIDVFYATRPGDPAYEVSQAQATRRYRGIFTEALLGAVREPGIALLDVVATGPPPLAVVTSRRLKPYLEELVSIQAGDFDVRLRQQPEVRVETALPKYFAVAPAHPAGGVGKIAGEEKELAEPFDPFIGEPLNRPPSSPFERRAPARTERTSRGWAVNRLLEQQERAQFAAHTGFTVFGTHVISATAPGWIVDPFIVDPLDPDAYRKGFTSPGAYRIGLTPDDNAWPTGNRSSFQSSSRPPSFRPSSLLLTFGRGSGTLLAIIPGFTATVVVRSNRVTSVSYNPSRSSWRFEEYQARAAELEAMKADVAVASRRGEFIVSPTDAEYLAHSIRQGKGLDPTLGLYAAYSYALVGKYKDVLSVFSYMRNESEIPVPFDVVMLAGRYDKTVLEDSHLHLAPFAPVLAQGWALLTPDHPLYQPLHGQLRVHLLPSLWTTYTAKGIKIIHEALINKPTR